MILRMLLELFLLYVVILIIIYPRPSIQTTGLVDAGISSLKLVFFIVVLRTVVHTFETITIDAFHAKSATLGIPWINS